MQCISGFFPLGGEDFDAHWRAQRKSRRYPLNADITVVKPRRLRGIAINVSAGGMRIALDGSLDVGALCSFRVSSARGRGTVKRGRVMWVRQHPDGCVVGLRFEAAVERQAAREVTSGGATAA